MATGTYWADNYVEKQSSAEKAISRIKPGQRVFIGSSCGEPQYLIQKLAELSPKIPDIEIIRLMSLQSTPLSMISDKKKQQRMNIRSFYLGSAESREIQKNLRFITPINLSAVPRLFKTRQLPIHVALIQVTPPDDFGWMSLGVSVDITLSAAFSADLVIAQVNPRMPRVLGTGFIHVNDVDFFIEKEEELLTVSKPADNEAAMTIARYSRRFIDDGATVHIGLGTTTEATLLALSEKNDLGVHTEYLTDEIMDLVARGVITNRKKGFNDGKLIAGSAMGTQYFYEFLDDNPSIEFHSSDYVNDPGIISRHKRMTSINVVKSIDLTGQVATDAMPYNHYSGVTGVLDFIRGSARAEGGKSILMLSSTSSDGKKSRILPELENKAVVVPRGDVQYVVTEYGAVNLFGKSFQERAMAMISIAHPDFRDELFEEAKRIGLLGEERTLKETIRGIYPLKLEETVEIDGETVTFRPAKPVDERRIQEHFYSLDKEDIVSRFFHERHSFSRDEMADLSQIDYIKDLTLIALVGEIGFGKVVGVGEYFLDEKMNMAEVAFSVNKHYQGKGIGKKLIRKMSRAAQDNGISGLIAYTSTENKNMIRLFKTLPYKVRTSFEDDMVILKCRFDEVE